jgi:hypothetical protein
MTKLLPDFVYLSGQEKSENVRQAQSLVVQLCTI